MPDRDPRSSHHGLSDRAFAVLDALSVLLDTRREDVVSGEQTAMELSRRSSMPTTGTLLGGRPWFGLRDEIEQLEALGLVERIIEAADYHAPTEPSPTGGDIWVHPTAAGWALVDPVGAV